MQEIPVLGNNYKIILEEKSSKLWSSENFRKLCIFKIRNNLGIDNLKIILSEEDIFTLISNLYQYIEFNQSYLGLTFNSNNTELKSYTFYFERKINNIILSISEYSSIYQTMINRILLEFNSELFLNFIFKIYNEFIEDIDDGNYSPDFLL